MKNLFNILFYLFGICLPIVVVVVSLIKSNFKINKNVVNKLLIAGIIFLIFYIVKVGGIKLINNKSDNKDVKINNTVKKKDTTTSSTTTTTTSTTSTTTTTKKKQDISVSNNTDGLKIIDGILIVNKTYSLPSDYAPGINHTALYYLHMLQADAKAVGIDIPVISAYRSYETQRALFDSYYAKDGDKADTYSARPGHSEHQTGLAFDVGAIDDNYGDTIGGKWLYNNCANYGFIIRYLKGKEDITGYKYEPWHIRYVGSVAEYIMNQGITLEEYLNIA